METELARALEALPADSAHRIRTALAFHNLKQGDFAKALGADEAKLSRQLNGYRPWPLEERERASKILGVSESLLFPLAPTTDEAKAVNS